MYKNIMLLPLTAAQLKLYATQPALLFKELKIKEEQPNIVSSYGDFRAELNDALITVTLPLIEQNSTDYALHTHHLIIDAELNCCVGGIGCYVEDRQNGSAQLGYYIFKQYEGSGYAKAAVNRFAQWLFSQTYITKLMATIPNNHITSEKVVLANGFSLIHRAELNTYQLNND